ncbi:MAG TPA: PH domain-containing protein [Bacillota bacterium]|nr:PH domain-containing protein [Bacillota bacterium]
MQRVRSAVDIWCGSLIWLTILILIISVVVVPIDSLFLFIAASPIMIFLLWIYFGTWYELRDNYLYSQSGPFRERIAYDKIKTLKLTSNMLSSMALSRQRIEIRQHGKGYFTGTTMISPINREDFLSELQKRCANLEMQSQK